MSSHERMLSILDLFDASRPYWTFDDLSAELGYSRSTLYRHLKILSDAELLTTLSGLGYTLGPRIIELDYQIRISDPLVRIAQPIMEELVGRFSGVALLCRRYRRSVICVHQVSSGDTVRSQYERGLRRPFFRGAASVIILAHLGGGQIGKLYDDQPEGFAASNLGSSLPQVKAQLKAIREQGWAITTGEVTAGNTGIACPLFDGRGEIIGSLSLTSASTSMTDSRIEQIADQMVFCAKIINNALAQA